MSICVFLSLALALSLCPLASLSVVREFIEFSAHYFTGLLRCSSARHVPTPFSLFIVSVTISIPILVLCRRLALLIFPEQNLSLSLLLALSLSLSQQNDHTAVRLPFNYLYSSIFLNLTTQFNLCSQPIDIASTHTALRGTGDYGFVYGLCQSDGHLLGGDGCDASISLQI